MTKSSLLFWQKKGVAGVGDMALLEQPLTAFFASRLCSGRAIRVAMDWAIEQARSKNPLIGGFHSPLEQSVLEVVLAAHAPVVIVVARQLHAASLPAACRMAQGNASRYSHRGKCGRYAQRLTAEQAIRRNHWIAQRAANIVVAEVSPEGNLATCVAQWVSEGRMINK